MNAFQNGTLRWQFTLDAIDNDLALDSCTLSNGDVVYSYTNYLFRVNETNGNYVSSSLMNLGTNFYKYDLKCSKDLIFVEGMTFNSNEAKWMMKNMSLTNA